MKTLTYSGDFTESRIRISFPAYEIFSSGFLIYLLIKLKYTLVAALTLLYLSGVNSDPGWLKNK
jgi:hypothetical protein